MVHKAAIMTTLPAQLGRRHLAGLTAIDAFSCGRQVRSPAGAPQFVIYGVERDGKAGRKPGKRGKEKLGVRLAGCFKAEHVGEVLS